eukprot:TRINITY_DN15971_c0_g1_i2.p1 TRINITY_DN15971_c0_g1~~TRINITY_DN15971_c0_g1_i2.p1  ORF type:complete len:192 (+),score=60.79 TRINITY_DN15971_c0_g1_i2:163-738(+)
MCIRDRFRVMKSVEAQSSAMVQRLQSQLAELQSSNQENRGRRRELEAEVATMTAQLNGCREDLIKFQRERNQAQADALEAEEKAGKLEEALDDMRKGGVPAAVVADLEVKLAAASAEAAEATAGQDRLTSELEEARNRVSALDEDVARLREQEMAALEGQEELKKQLSRAHAQVVELKHCLLYTSPSPRDS